MNRFTTGTERMEHMLGTGTAFRMALIGLMLLAAPASALGSNLKLSGSDRTHSGGQSAPFKSGELIVRFYSGVSADTRKTVRQRFDTRVEHAIGSPKLQLLRLDPSDSVRGVAKDLAKQDSVKFAEPNYLAHLDSTTPSDPSFDQLWGLNNTGQDIGGLVGVPDADIDAPEAWDITKGSASVRIGVTDTGINQAHPDLVKNIWTNPGETGSGKETNGIDDDHNGLVDDWQGWDFGNSDNDPDDEEGHGTHVSGTIAARGNNGIGVAGVNWRASIIPIKVCAAGCAASDVAAGFLYAASNGARVVNASLGVALSSAIEDAIHDSPGTLFVTSAGNTGINVDSKPQYPCSFDADNVICVAASDSSDRLSEFQAGASSNFGKHSVDLAAPGDKILSTVPDSLFDHTGYVRFEGTSMASPHVAGVAGLVAAANPSLSPTEIKSAILDNVDVKPSLSNKVLTGGRLNAFKAVAATVTQGQGAAKAGVENSTLWYAAPSGQSNDVSISSSGGTATVTDLNVPLEARSGCTQAGAHTVTCVGATAVRVNTGDGDDNVALNTALSSTLEGGSGNDSLTGGSGDDALEAGSGQDHLIGGSGDDVVNGGSGDDTIDGGSDKDTVDYSEHANGVNVNLGNGTGGGSGEADQLTGIEDVRGGSAADILTGNAGPNSIDGGFGNDQVNGAAGTDAIDYSEHANGVNVNLGNGTGGGSGEADQLTGIEDVRGGSAADILTGNAGPNSIDGGLGNDQIDGGLGNDQIDGAAGTDTIDYSHRTASVAVGLGAGTGGGGGELDQLAGIDNIVGSSAGDTLTGNTGPNSIDGGLGNDQIDGAGGTDIVDYSRRTASIAVDLGAGTGGGSGEFDQLVEIDNIVGSSAGDTLSGNAGPNSIDGGLGDDYVNGFGGADTIDYSPRVDVPVTVDLRTGVAGATDEADHLTGMENITGGAAGDILTGDAGPNLIDGGAGYDTLDGQPGDDQILGGTGNDVVYGGDGQDLIRGGETRDTLHGGNGVDMLDGGPREDQIFGDAGDDTVLGRGGNDSLSGGSGNDFLSGESGADSASGGAGYDTVSYSERSETVTVTLNGAADDGAADDSAAISVNDPVFRDNVASDNELVVGGSGDDTFEGDSGANSFNGGPGNDTMEGRAGDDTLDGGAGHVSFSVGTGNDDLQTRDGENDSPIACGSGADTVTADPAPLDPAGADCETVDRGGAGTNDSLITGKSLKLTSSANPASKQLIASSADSTIGLGGGNGSVDDPTLSDVTVRVVSAAFDNTYALPHSRWTYIGGQGQNKGYKYTDSSLAFGPIKTAEFRAHDLKLSGKGAGLGHSLATNPNPVAVVFAVGGQRYCMSFGGTVKFSAGRLYQATNSLAPLTCPPTT